MMLGSGLLGVLICVYLVLWFFPIRSVSFVSSEGHKIYTVRYPLKYADRITINKDVLDIADVINFSYVGEDTIRGISKPSTCEESMPLLGETSVSSTDSIDGYSFCHFSEPVDNTGQDGGDLLLNPSPGGLLQIGY